MLGANAANPNLCLWVITLDRETRVFRFLLHSYLVERFSQGTLILHGQQGKSLRSKSAGSAVPVLAIEIGSCAMKE